LLALACGSDDSNNNDAPSGGDDIIEPPPLDDLEGVPEGNDCDLNPLDRSCDEPEANPPGGGGDDPPPIDDPAEIALANVTNILADNCGQCHGALLDEEDAEAGMNFITDLERLSTTNSRNGRPLIDPLNSGGSFIVQRMRDGSMPPGQLPKVSTRDIDVVAEYIDNPAFWPEVDVEDCSDSNQNIDFDVLFEEINRDLSGEDADDQVNYRYLVLTNRFNAGVCSDTQLDRDRQSLVKMMNALSSSPTIEIPLDVNGDGLIYRIDLRDFEWDRAISVNGENFNDVWEAIAGNNDYAVAFEGDDADDAVADTGTTVPFMFADSVADVAMVGNLYYAIVGVDVAQTLDVFISDVLDIDVVANLEDEELIRAGTSESVLSRQDTVVERHEIEARAGAFWQRFDFDDDANESIFQDPFGFEETGREAIFTLENNMMGFIIADADGNILEDSDILLDFNQNNFRVTTAISCVNCHAQGFIPVVDQVRDVALRNAIALDLDNDEVEALREVYPTSAEFAQQVADDTDVFQAALERAELPISSIDPISSVFLRFDLDMKLADAAGDLGVSPDFLQSNLRELNPAVQVLDNTVLDRDDFTQFYLNSLCILSITLENAPVVADCDDAQAEVDALIQ
jgi:mono/diheme cytochrome c family protein